MKLVRVIMVLVSFITLLTMSMEAYAASARVRCRVEPGRVRVQVDGQDLPKGKYRATVKNLVTGAIAKTEPGKEKTVSTTVGDVDLDFDTTAGPADLDSYIPANFARAGERVRARVINAKTGVFLAAASNVCVQK